MRRTLVGLVAITTAVWIGFGGYVPSISSTEALGCDRQPEKAVRDMVEQTPFSATMHLHVIHMGRITTFQNKYGTTVCKTTLLMNNDQEYTLVFRVIERDGAALLEGRLTQ